ncbi:hypothetical protein EV356DRAFT_301767 [Viridothelium virens]|uniref:Uncharacterized protein n=1 Tax=Viridothelium virens TaxID=1048519 RepID=A0A6A6HJD9_VIRVR|nr:hypothetical protein EV356DRAFT_301767 [Viridothelium virens]
MNLRQRSSSSTQARSLLFRILPSYVRNRIPRIASFRRTSDGNHESRRSYSIDSLDVGTPPPNYSPPTLSDGTETDSRGSLELDMQSDDITMISEEFLNAGAQSKSGILWKYGNQGINLLNLAAHESNRPPQHSGCNTPLFSRHLYVDGLTYLLRALPEDLTAEEYLRIRAALPIKARGCRLTLISQDQSLVARPEEVAPVKASSEDVSAIHRFFAFVTIQFFLIIHYLLPYVKLLLAFMYRYERENRVCERVVRSTLDAIDSVGQRSIEMVGAVCKLNDGKVGQAMQEFGSWWIQGMAGGLHEGIGEGLAIVGATPSSPRQARR